MYKLTHPEFIGLVPAKTGKTYYEKNPYYERNVMVYFQPGE